MPEHEDHKITAILDRDTESKLIRLAKKFERSVSAQLRVMIKEYPDND